MRHLHNRNKRSLTRHERCDHPLAVALFEGGAEVEGAADVFDEDEAVVALAVFHFFPVIRASLVLGPAVGLDDLEQVMVELAHDG